jgi:hypothetical protein
MDKNVLGTSDVLMGVLLESVFSRDDGDLNI